MQLYRNSPWLSVRLHLSQYQKLNFPEAVMFTFFLERNKDECRVIIFFKKVSNNIMLHVLLVEEHGRKVKTALRR